MIVGVARPWPSRSFVQCRNTETPLGSSYESLQLSKPMMKRTGIDVSIFGIASTSEVTSALLQTSSAKVSSIS